MLVFVLELTNNKYFIGHTNNSTFDLCDFNSDKFYWTRKYKPQCVIDILENDSISNYFYIINSYMEIYGVKNVYATDSDDSNIDTSFNYENMNDKTKSVLICCIKEQSQTNCILCGNNNHITSECDYFDTLIEDKEINEKNEYGFDSVELNDEKMNENYSSCNIEVDMDMDINEICNTDDDVEKLRQERNYYYELSYYWYYQACSLKHYYEQYYHQMYNNQYNFIQI